MLENRAVLISGASVAGSALAYWLSRHGFKPTVVERAPALRDGGYAIDIRGAALDVIERMGIMAEVRRASIDMHGMSYVNSAGKPLANVHGDLFAGASNGGDVEIMRGDLTRILNTASQDDTEYLFDNSITAMSEDAEGIRVTFERGAPRTFHLVVGADGLHSNVRTLAFGAESRFIRYLGYYISIFSVANHLDLAHWTLLYNVPGKLAVIYGARQDTDAKAIFGFASQQLYHDHRDSGQQKKLLADAFAGEGWEIPRLIEAVWNSPDFYFDSISQIHMDSWTNGRVALLGDAGYCPSPASGQGASLALAGAYVLAGELKANADHRTAFARYEAEIRGYVNKNQKIALAAAEQVIPRTWRRIWFRNQLIRALPYLPARDRLTGGVQRAANALTLKDY